MAAFNIYGRLSFEHVFTPSATEGSEPTYSASILMPKGSSEVKKVEAEMMRVANEKWGAKGKETLAKLVKTNKVCLHDGDTKDYDGYSGMDFVTARNPVRPAAFDKNGDETEKADGLIYSGCYVQAGMNFGPKTTNTDAESTQNFLASNLKRMVTHSALVPVLPRRATLT